jgi:hypothetical protein
MSFTWEQIGTMAAVQWKSLSIGLGRTAVGYSNQNSSDALLFAHLTQCVRLTTR